MDRWPKRTGVAIAVGVAFGGLALWARLSGRSNFSDFDQIWLAGRAILHGGDPYRAVLVRLQWPLFYPMPAAVVGMPFSLLPPALAGPLFVGIGFGLLAYGLASQSWWPLVGLASWPALDAAQLCQWTPLLTAAALLPWLGWAAVAKPTTGAATAGAYLSRHWLSFNLAVGALLIAVSFVLVPSWLGEWGEAVRNARHFRPMILRPGGAVLLLALLRWSQPQARLLALLAIVPQIGTPYEALPLILACSDRREALAYGFLSFAAMPFLHEQTGTGPAYVAATNHNATVLLVALYFPALAAVLFRKRTPAGASVLTIRSGSVQGE
jgi:hypothetical protein